MHISWMLNGIQLFKSQGRMAEISTVGHPPALAHLLDIDMAGRQHNDTKLME